MMPAARLQAAIEIVTALNETAQPADRFLRYWFASRRYAGSKDRAAVGERVYDMARRRASYVWRMGGDEPRRLAIASLLHEGLDSEAIAVLFSAGGHGPEPLSAEEREALLSPPPGAMPLSAECEFPAWLEPELTRAFGTDLREEMLAMAERAPVDLRVNTLRATRDEILAGLRSLGISVEETLYSPVGIRVPSAHGLKALSQSPLFLAGAFEFQDEASQLAAFLCGAKPGQRVLDLAAGAGGKSLALAAIMENKGAIVTNDFNPARLKDLGPRAIRAGVEIITAAANARELKAQDFDIVLVDAPCSGSGAWRRSPEAKWRLTPERLKELTALQGELLDTGARSVKPGGRLVYATCSLFPSENEDAVAAFLTRNTAFRRYDAASSWNEAIGQAPHFVTDYFRAGPLASGTDGFFVSIMIRE